MELIKTETLSVWTIFDRPLDYPHGFIARKFNVKKGAVSPTKEIILGNDLEVIRNKLASQGLVAIPRSPEDNQSVVETWI